LFLWGEQTVLCRLRDSSSPFNKNLQKTFVDGDLLWRFCDATEEQRNFICHQIGTHTSKVLDDLLQVDRTLDLF
jgi:hypothetical protein